MMMRRLGSSALFLGALLAAHAAEASPTYPDEIKTHLGAASTPQCSVCHAGGMTGTGTVTTLFGTAMKAHKLVPENIAALDTALDAMKAEKVDSDKDGVTDVQELIDGTDPNTAGGVVTAAPPPLTYGCAATIAPGAPAGSGAALGLCAVALGVLAARRRRKGLAAAAVIGAAALGALGAGCYETSFVTADVCPTGLLWTGGNSGSELMHPGVACLECHQHDGPKFNAAGTVYPANMADDCVGSPNATIVVTDADNKSYELKVNAAGNFYTPTSLKMPYHAMVVSGGKQKLMAGAQTTGDCNSCHTEKGKNGAPGRITLP